MVRDRQNRRSETLPSLPPPVRRRLHLCHAHQRVRSGRQLSSRERPRHSCANPTRSCGEAIGAPTVSVWGAGTPRREFIFVDDLADACVFVLEQYSGESPLNVGTGEDITIADLARLIAQVIGYRGELVFDICPVRTERRESYSTCPSCGRLAGRHIRRLPSALSEVMPTFFPGMGGIKSESHHQRPATMANVGDELRWQADF